jgi:uncharacterized protein YciI
MTTRPPCVAASLALCALLAPALAAAAEPPAPRPAYDAALARKLGADDRGMKAYVLVVLKPGPKAEISKEEARRLFIGHMANIKRLEKEGLLVVAGPFDTNGQGWEGLFVLNVKTVKEADALLVTDPAIAAGRFSYQALVWYGSAGLQESPGLHARLEKPAK